VSGVADVAFEVVRRDLDHLEVYVVPSDGEVPHAQLASAIRLALSTALPPALVPRRVHVVPAILTNANGKVDLRATRAQLERAPESSAAGVVATPS